MRTILVLLLTGSGLVNSSLTWAEPAARWTLAASIQRAVEVAPEMKTADAEIGKQQGKLEQAGAWPNPSVSIQVNNKLGIEDASGGYDVTQLAISQPLPIARLTHQRKQAEAGLAVAEAQRRQQQLSLEHKVAQRFHALQLAEAKLQLAEERFQQARLIWYSRHGRVRLLNTVSSQVRSLNTFCNSRIVSFTAQALG